MRKVALMLIGLFLWTGTAWAVPETVSVRATDVTPSSFAVAWMTDVTAEPTVQVFLDASGANEITEAVDLATMPDASSAVAAAAREKGVMKVRVSGLSANTTYWVRTMTVDPDNPDSTGYSSLREVTTAGSVVPYRQLEDGSLSPLANDLLGFRVYIRPADPADVPGMGDLLLLETSGSRYPVSAFAGEGSDAPEGVLDLNNLFGLEGASLDVDGGETAALRIYRGGTLSTLLHYRRFPADGGRTAVAEPVRGFFADVNLDGRVDAEDFDFFKAQYRQGADDAAFNPDFNFMPAEEGGTVSADVVDARDFARFATQYGRADVE